MSRFLPVVRSMQSIRLLRFTLITSTGCCCQSQSSTMPPRYLRKVPYRVVCRFAPRKRFVVFETFDHKEAVAYVYRAEYHDGDNAHYSIDSRCRRESLCRMPRPMPLIPE